MKCPICSNKKAFTSLSPRFCQAENYLCGKCGLVFIPNRKRPIGQYYKSDGYFKESPNIAYRRDFISKSLLIKEAGERVESALKILPIQLKGKTVLDVGCGYGEILYSVKNNYYSKVTGIEPSSQTAEYGNKLFRVFICPLLLEEFVSKKDFEVIWCSHVLEHTDDPNFFLKKIKKLLKKGGYFYIEVPNILKPSGGFNLNMFLYSEHLQTFSIYNLFLLLKKNGFKIVRYSDSYFLKVWCQSSNHKKEMSVPFVSAEEVFSFLGEYQRDYDLFKAIKVYIDKMLYATKIILYKTRDIF